MKIVYETFKEIADALTDGTSVFHVLDSPHDEDCCMVWQQAIHDFAK